MDFPEFDLLGIQAKIDTGAYTSSIHCHSIKEIDDLLEFELVHPIHFTGKSIRYKTKSFRKKRIKSSNGSIQERYLIKTKITLQGHTYKSEFSLANRSKMKYPVLIGRRLLKNRFLVDVSISNEVKPAEK